MFRVHFKTCLWRRTASIFAKRAAFAKSRSGTIAVIFAFSALPVFGLVGAAIDYSTLSQTRATLQNLADSAAIAAVSEIAASNTQLSETEMRKISQDQFLAGLTSSSVGQKNKWNWIAWSTNASMKDNMLKIDLNFTGNLKTTFGNIFNNVSNTANVRFQASAQRQLSPYVDVYVLVDTSASMGIGATVADQNRLAAAFNGCELACHDGARTDNQARNLGITTRIDVIRGGLLDIVKDVNRTQVPGHFRFGIYRFRTDFNTLVNISGDLEAVKSQVKAIELDGTSAGQGTNFDTAVAALTKKIQGGGDGSSPQSPRPFVFIMTDGLADDEDARTSNHRDPRFVLFAPTVKYTPTWPRFQGFNPTLCDQLKSKGATVMTLNTKYILPQAYNGSYSDPNAWPTQVRDILLPKIETNLKQCASLPKYSFLANDPTSIQNAIKAMLEATLQSVRLTK